MTEWDCYKKDDVKHKTCKYYNILNIIHASDWSIQLIWVQLCFYTDWSKQRHYISVSSSQYSIQFSVNYFAEDNIS